MQRNFIMSYLARFLIIPILAVCIIVLAFLFNILQCWIYLIFLNLKFESLVLFVGNYLKKAVCNLNEKWYIFDQESLFFCRRNLSSCPISNFGLDRMMSLMCIFFETPYNFSPIKRIHSLKAVNVTCNLKKYCFLSNFVEFILTWRLMMKKCMSAKFYFGIFRNVVSKILLASLVAPPGNRRNFTILRTLCWSV